MQQACNVSICCRSLTSRFACGPPAICITSCVILLKYEGDNNILIAHCAGIADGVGGWSQINIDSGVYSRMLMQTAQAAAAITPPSPIAPQIILEEAHAKTNVKVNKPFMQKDLVACRQRMVTLQLATVTAQHVLQVPQC